MEQSIYQSGPYGNVPVSLEVRTVEDFEGRWHPYAELNYVLSGHFTVMVRNQTFDLDPDDLILINPYELHSAQTQNCKVAVFRIDYVKFGSNVVADRIFLDCNSRTASDPASMRLLKYLLANLAKISASSADYSILQNISYSYALMHHLMVHYSVQASTDEAKRQHQLVRIEEILRYCGEHYTEGITLSSLADHFYLTPPYMSKLFKATVGTTFSKYMDGIRLEHVLREINRRDLSAEDLAERNGFPSGRSMNAAFRRKYGVSLNQYRASLTRNAKQQSNLQGLYAQHSNDLQILAQYLDLPIHTGKQSPPPRRIMELAPVNMQGKSHPMPRSIFRRCNVGNAKDLLLTDIQSALRMIQRDLHFETIGFHGLLDDSMMLYSEKSDGTPELSFTLIDKAFDFLQEIELDPVLELSFMPSQLARPDANTMFYHRSFISLPKSDAKWAFLVQGLFRHLIYRYGRSTVARWPVLIWSTPDSTTQEFGLGGVRAYYEFYRKTWQLIKAILPECSIECPSLRNYTLENATEFGQFLALCRTDACMPTAINVSYFPINHTEQLLNNDVQSSSHLQFRSSPSAMQESIQRIRRNAELRQWGPLPIKLSAWNSSLSHRDLLNDTVYKATYIVKNALENCSELDAMGYWVVSDFVEEVQIPGEQYHGGLGLLTSAGIRKAAYYGYWVLAQLGNTLIDRGDGYCVSLADDGSIRILFYNYLHFNDLYTRGELFDMSFTNRYTAFSSRLQKKYVLPLEGLDANQYLLCETIINAKSGSSFDCWVDMGALPIDSQEDVDYLNDVSRPQRKKEMLVCPGGQITISRTLNAHEIRLLLMHPMVNQAQ